MKGYYSLSDLKTKKKIKYFLKKQLSNRIRFFMVTFPMRTELVFLITFLLLGTPIDLFCSVKGNFGVKFS